MSLQGGRRISPEAAGAVALSDTIKAVYGTTATVLTAPAGDYKMLVMMADVGDWRVRLGSVAGSMPASADPGAAITDGTGGAKIGEGKSLVIPCNGSVTVKGYTATSVLTYWWL